MPGETSPSNLSDSHTDYAGTGHPLSASKGKQLQGDAESRPGTSNKIYDEDRDIANIVQQANDDNIDVDETTRLIPRQGVYEHNREEEELLEARSRRALLGNTSLPIILYTLLFITGTQFLLNLIAPFIPVISRFVLIYTPGASFFMLAHSFLAFISINCSIVFMRATSKIERRISLCTLILLSVEFMVVLIVPGVRHSFGLVGLFTIFWTGFVIGVGEILASWVIEARKQALFEEELFVARNNAHDVVDTDSNAEAESEYSEASSRISPNRVRRIERKTLTEWVGVGVSSLLSLVILTLTFLLTLTVFVNAFDSLRVPRPKFIEPVKWYPRFSFWGSYSAGSSYLYCLPSHVHSPTNQTVLLIPGDTASGELMVEEWLEQVWELNRVGRVCVWDPPGWAWSNVGSVHGGLERQVEMLEESLYALKKNNVSTPDDGLDPHKPDLDPPFALDKGKKDSDKKKHDPDDEEKELPPLFVISHGPGSLSAMILASRHTKSDVLGYSPIRNMLFLDPMPPSFARNFYYSYTHGISLYFQGLLAPFKGIVWLFSSIFNDDNQGAETRVWGRRQHEQVKWIQARLKDNIEGRKTTMRQVNIALGTLRDSDIRVSVVSSSWMIEQVESWSLGQREVSEVTGNNIVWRVVDAGHNVWRGKGRREVQRLVENIINLYH
ncbi:hypothetical protein NADFUDRAFT_53558 [Nadsonia fulvescens var. elongata DSM 6958]|uniref:AB hydrolase-1 domain-containing protein n=1 Tax=Nadsonia fulvescens var. elongata DSM 6958 TaxID=857566 RepID=A0A1E3PEH7_9ASCO|nr:hypothetical protein NADFUDRAFT_53558 [Nadsonia fulvescens var. elongata DSM 6958]